MTRICDVLDSSLALPFEAVTIDESDRDVLLREFGECEFTDHLKIEYERLFRVIAEGQKVHGEHAGVWICGPPGSGKSALVKTLGYVLANRRIGAADARSLFLKRVASQRIEDGVAFLNRKVPYEIFLCNLQARRLAGSPPKPLAEVMYQALLENLGYAEDSRLADLEIELERKGKLPAFEELCRTEFGDEWRSVRRSKEAAARAEALLVKLRLPGTETGFGRVTIVDLVNKSFASCERRRPGRAFAFVLDEFDPSADPESRWFEDLCAIVREFGKESLARRKSGKIPGPVWVIVAARETPQQIDERFAALPVRARASDLFKHRVQLPASDVAEFVKRRVLLKSEGQVAILRNLFREHGLALTRNLSFEKSPRHASFDEEQFVRSYPYPPYLIDLSLEILEGVLRYPGASRNLDGGNRSVVRQAFEMLVSRRTCFADQPLGHLVSLDLVYDLLEPSVPPEKQKEIRAIRERFDGDTDYPGMTGRVAKAICLLELAGGGLPSTPKNIAGTLVRWMTEPPPVVAVVAVLFRLKDAGHVRKAESGWKMNDLGELRRVTTSLKWLNRAIGAINPRPAGWHNEVIQRLKKVFARSLRWYTRPVREFNTSVRRSLDEMIGMLDHVSANQAALEHSNGRTVEQLSMNIVALENRLASLESRLPVLKNHRPFRTAYLIGLFGSGRRYLNELMVRNLGERAQYFRDMIRLHPGPTPMVYSGHATLKYFSRAQAPPETMRGILEAVQSGFADLIFIYRHPLDSVLTNWVHWRGYLRENRWIAGISQVYENTDDLCADLDQNFSDFEAFAHGDPAFFAGLDPRFLSFAEFVEETAMHVQSATLAVRLEDFMVDPLKEFSRVLQAMAVNPDPANLSLLAPMAKPYGYRAVQEKVPRFRKFIEELSSDTRARIEMLGYTAVQ